MKGRCVLITGATGIMGSWVLAGALDRGYRPIVLMRDSDPAQARKRVDAVLRLVKRDSELDKVRIVFGDVRRPALGLDPNVLQELRATLDGFIHCAACISFDARQKDELWATNVEGVTHMLRFLAGTSIPLYHVSTAYVAGRRQGRVLETELDLNQTFNNMYEESKLEAESLVNDALDDGNISGAVFRPGILVGASKDGRISQFLNFYGFLQLIDIAASGALNGQRRLRFVADPTATKNLVPVDWAAEALWRLIETEGASGQTYHLTNPAPVTHENLREWANELLRPCNIRIEATERLDGDGSRFEWVAHSTLRHYLPYMQCEPLFDRTNTDKVLGDSLPFPHIGPEFYDTLMAFARERRWQGIFKCNSKGAATNYQAIMSRILEKAARAAMPGRRAGKEEKRTSPAADEAKKSAVA